MTHGKEEYNRLLDKYYNNWAGKIVPPVMAMLSAIPSESIFPATRAAMLAERQQGEFFPEGITNTLNIDACLPGSAVFPDWLNGEALLKILCQATGFDFWKTVLSEVPEVTHNLAKAFSQIDRNFPVRIGSAYEHIRVARSLEANNAKQYGLAVVLFGMTAALGKGVKEILNPKYPPKNLINAAIAQGEAFDTPAKNLDEFLSRINNLFALGKMYETLAKHKGFMSQPPGRQRRDCPAIDFTYSWLKAIGQVFADPVCQPIIRSRISRTSN